MRFWSASKKDQNRADAIYHPERFADRLLNQDLWSKQQIILQSLSAHKRTAVKACHASGKTFLAAVAVLWFLIRHKDAIVLTTAPTWLQIEQVLWREIHQIVAQSEISYPRPTATSLQIGPRRFALGLSTDQGVRFQGYHSDHMLVVVDEAPGIDAEIWEAIEGIRAGGDVRVLALGNPTIASGKFHDYFQAEGQGWNLHTISAWDTPNLAGVKLSYQSSGEAITLGDPNGRDLLDLSEAELDDNVRPYLTTRRWVKEKYLEWGPGHPLWESRVLGQFPSQDEYSLIPIAWAEAARDREIGVGESEPIDAGLDVADGGENETVLCIRQGAKILYLNGWSKKDPRGDLVSVLLPYKPKLRSVNVDTVGVGAYMEKHLRDQGLPTNAVNVGLAAQNKERFCNAKAECYWGLRERFQQQAITGMTDKAIGQLTSIRWSTNPRGQIVIESKEDLRKRGVKSPDHAEALMLAYASRSNSMLEFYRREVMEQRRMMAQALNIAIPDEELPAMIGPGPSPWDAFNW
jgi:phage terminase large subunit